MSLQENIKKKIFVPPLNHSGGGHFGCPPPELLRRGTILRGGQSPPEIAQGGGQSPIPPPVSALVYIYMSIYYVLQIYVYIYYMYNVYIYKCYVPMIFMSMDECIIELSAFLHH